MAATTTTATTKPRPLVRHDYDYIPNNLPNICILEIDERSQQCFFSTPLLFCRWDVFVVVAVEAWRGGRRRRWSQQQQQQQQLRNWQQQPILSQIYSRVSTGIYLCCHRWVIRQHLTDHLLVKEHQNPSLQEYYVIQKQRLSYFEVVELRSARSGSSSMQRANHWNFKKRKEGKSDCRRRVSHYLVVSNKECIGWKRSAWWFFFSGYKMASFAKIDFRLIWFHFQSRAKNCPVKIIRFFIRRSVVRYKRRKREK